jgi:Uri superfamily endonuclease
MKVCLSGDPDKWLDCYLLTAPGVRVAEVIRSRRNECALNRAVRGRVWVVGFGASDCNWGKGARLD